MYSLGGHGSHDLEHQSLMQKVSGLVVLSDTWANRPAAPFTNQRFWSTDRGMEFYYDGTRWLSSQLFPANFDLDQARAIVTGAVAGTAYAAARVVMAEPTLVSGNNGIRLDMLVFWLVDTSANNHTVNNYFDWVLQYSNTAGGVSGGIALAGTANTQGHPAAGATRGYNLLATTPVVIGDSAVFELTWTLTLRGAAPTVHTIYPLLAGSYRLIG